DEFGQQVLIATRSPLDIELALCPGSARLAEPSPKVRVAREQTQPVGEAVDVSDGDQVALLPVFDDVAYRAAVARHDRDAGCHRFDEGDRYPLVNRRQARHIQTGQE